MLSTWTTPRSRTRAVDRTDRARQVSNLFRRERRDNAHALGLARWSRPSSASTAPLEPSYERRRGEAVCGQVAIVDSREQPMEQCRFLVSLSSGKHLALTIPPALFPCC